MQQSAVRKMMLSFPDLVPTTSPLPEKKLPPHALIQITTGLIPRKLKNNTTLAPATTIFRISDLIANSHKLTLILNLWDLLLIKYQISDQDLTRKQILNHQKASTRKYWKATVKIRKAIEKLFLTFRIKIQDQESTSHEKVWHFSSKKRF